MSDWQSLALYNKIAFHTFIVNHRRMSGFPSEIDSLNSLDPLAIAAIHDRYYPEVYRFARFRLSDVVLAEDITGEVFLRLLEAVHVGHGPHTNLRGWLLRTASNMVNDHFRRIYARPEEDPPEVLENVGAALPHSDPVTMWDQAETNRLLRSAINKLTDAQKMVITLRFGNRLSLEETALVMGKNSNTIKALQCRALIALRQRLGNDIR